MTSKVEQARRTAVEEAQTAKAKALKSTSAALAKSGRLLAALEAQECATLVPAPQSSASHVKGALS